MSFSRLFSAMLVVGVSAGATIVACGGNSSPKTPDAKVFKDAPVPMDAPAGVTGLGQKCGSALPACPSNASACIGATGTTQFCTPSCEMNGSGKTDAQGNFPASGSGSIMPAPNNTTCTGAFTGTVGTPSCSAIVMSTPSYTGQANTSFTAIQMDCLVLCGTGSGTGACPTGMTCNTSFGACFPN
jgi:hypothetical protein